MSSAEQLLQESVRCAIRETLELFAPEDKAVRRAGLNRLLAPVALLRAEVTRARGEPLVRALDCS